MWHADGGGLRHRRVGGQRALHLRRSETLPGDGQGVVGAPVEEPESVLVSSGPVAVQPGAGEPTPVRVEVLLRVAPDPSRHRGPGLSAHELPHLPGRDREPGGIDDVDVHPERGASERARLQVRDRQRREEARPHLRPSAQVDDRQTRAADLPVQPEVVGVPRLTRRGEDPQRRQVVSADVVRSRRDDRAISVGETPRVVMRCRWTSDQSRSGAGCVGRRRRGTRSSRARAPDDLPAP